MSQERLLELFKTEFENTLPHKGVGHSLRVVCEDVYLRVVELAEAQDLSGKVLACSIVDIVGENDWKGWDGETRPLGLLFSTCSSISEDHQWDVYSSLLSLEGEVDDPVEEMHVLSSFLNTFGTSKPIMMESCKRLKKRLIAIGVSLNNDESSDLLRDDYVDILVRLTRSKVLTRSKKEMWKTLVSGFKRGESTEMPINDKANSLKCISDAMSDIGQCHDVNGVIEVTIKCFESVRLLSLSGSKRGRDWSKSFLRVFARVLELWDVAFAQLTEFDGLSDITLLSSSTMDFVSNNEPLTSGLRVLSSELDTWVSILGNLRSNSKPYTKSLNFSTLLKFLLFEDISVARPLLFFTRLARETITSVNYKLLFNSVLNLEYLFDAHMRFCSTNEVPPKVAGNFAKHSLKASLSTLCHIVSRFIESQPDFDFSTAGKEFTRAYNSLLAFLAISRDFPQSERVLLKSFFEKFYMLSGENVDQLDEDFTKERDILTRSRLLECNREEIEMLFMSVHTGLLSHPLEVKEVFYAIDQVHEFVGHQTHSTVEVILPFMVDALKCGSDELDKNPSVLLRVAAQYIARSMSFFCEGLDSEKHSDIQESALSAIADFDVKYPCSPMAFGASTSFSSSSFNDELLEYYSWAAPEAKELETRKQVMSQVLFAVRKVDHSAQVVPFGSCASGFSSKSSDIDLGIFRQKEVTDLEKQIQFLKQTRKNLYKNRHITSIEGVFRTRVPLLKLIFDSQFAEMEVDLSFGNRNSELKSNLLSTYSLIDSRVPALVLTVKRWAKSRGICDSPNGFMNAFAHTLLCLQFLQSTSPPVIPLLSESGDWSVVIQKFTSKNTSTVGQLFHSYLFSFLLGFDYTKNCISVRTGSMIKDLSGAQRKEKFDKEHRISLCIEDPVDESDNVARNVSQGRIRVIVQEFARAYELLEGGGTFEALCEPIAPRYNNTDYTESKSRIKSSVATGKIKNTSPKVLPLSKKRILSSSAIYSEHVTFTELDRLRSTGSLLCGTVEIDIVNDLCKVSHGTLSITIIGVALRNRALNNDLVAVDISLPSPAIVAILQRNMVDDKIIAFRGHFLATPSHSSGFITFTPDEAGSQPGFLVGLSEYARVANYALDYNLDIATIPMIVEFVEWPITSDLPFGTIDFNWLEFYINQLPVSMSGIGVKESPKSSIFKKIEEAKTDKISKQSKKSAKSSPQRNKPLVSEKTKKPRHGNRLKFSEFLPVAELLSGVATGKFYSGRLNITRARGIAYVSVEGFPRDILIEGRKERNRTYNNDLVAVELLPVNPDDDEDRRRGTVVGVVESNISEESNIVGYITPWNESDDLSKEPRLRFLPQDGKTPLGVLFRKDIPAELLKDVTTITHSLFVVNYCKWTAENSYPRAVNVQFLGDVGDLDTEVNALLYKHEIRYEEEFSTGILDSLAAQLGDDGDGWTIPQCELDTRVDLRESLIFSIDPSTARDLDDALSITDKGSGVFEVGVHIADVSYFVKPDSPLDLEARFRSTSIYLKNRVIPMLPRILCEQLCSLNGGVERLAFSVFFEMSEVTGEVDFENARFVRSVIKNQAQMDYGTAQKIILGDSVSLDNTRLAPAVLSLHKLAKGRRERRFAEGALDLSGSEMYFELDDQGKPTSVRAYQRFDSHFLVEEMMLLANECAARRLVTTKTDLALLRSHPPPDTVEKLVMICKHFGIDTELKTALDFSEAMKVLATIPCGPTLNMATVLEGTFVRNMNPAEYICINAVAPQEWGHFNLNLGYYTHFTSPIRRYPDLIVHRLLSDSYPAGFSSTDVVKITTQCNKRTQQCRTLEMDLDILYLTELVQTRSVKTLGIIVDAGENSCKVYIPEYSIEEMVRYKQLTENGGAVSADLVEGSYFDQYVRVTWDKEEPEVAYHMFQEIQVSIQAKEGLRNELVVTFIKP